MKFGVIQFPGSNCERDVLHACKDVLEIDARLIDYRAHDLTGYDCIILPGGFSYGDYVRSGALAKLSPCIRDVKEFAARGGLVLGICNGFQILLECGLLPGAMLNNRHLQFRCEWVHLRCENWTTPFTRDCPERLRMPIAHGEGNYYIDADGLERLENNGQIVFRYCDEQGQATDAANPNGALRNIAGVVSKTKNVLGLMPHPERACEKELGGETGKSIFLSMVYCLSAVM